MNTDKSPIVSILMPFYNAEDFLEESINAVLNQTYKNFDFYIVNDGSTDSSEKIVSKYSFDTRIKYLVLSTNKGIVEALNLGLNHIKTKYIVRTDADDCCLPDMVESLVDFMESNPEFIVCGGNMRVIGSDKVISYIADNDALKVSTLGSCPFSHSTVIIQTAVLNKNHLFYSNEIIGAEDYLLWSKLLIHGKFGNLPKVTLEYRESTNQITASKNYSDNFNNNKRKIYNFHGGFFFNLSADEKILYSDLIQGKAASSLDELKAIGNIILKVLNTNKINNHFNPKMLKHMLFIKFNGQCLSLTERRFITLPIFLKYFIILKKYKNIGAFIAQFYTFFKVFLTPSSSTPIK